MTASTIVLYGHFGSGNIGNDSSLEAALHHIRELAPLADLICVCNGPDEIARRFHINTIPIDVSDQHGCEEAVPGRGLLSFARRMARRIYDEINFWAKQPAWFRSVNLFIIVGTGAVDDMAVRWPWQGPYELYKWCKAAKFGGTQVIFLSVGVGPIVNRISKFLMLKALKMADYRSYREAAAFSYLNGIRYNTSGDHLYPDVVFSLPKELLPAPRKSPSAPTVVGLGLINYYGWRHDPAIGETVHKEYFSKIKQIASWLFEKGHTIRILSGDTTDWWVVKEFVEFVNKDGKPDWRDKFFVEDIIDVNVLFSQIAQTDLVISSRFHNVLCSLMLERPVISLGYHEKNVNLMTDMGLGEYCQHIEDFSVEKLIDQFLSCERESTQIKERIQAHLAQYRRQLDEQYRNIIELSGIS